MLKTGAALSYYPSYIGFRLSEGGVFVAFVPDPARGGVLSIDQFYGQMRKAREQVMEANEEAIYKRKAAREKEKEELEAVLAYQAMKVLVLALSTYRHSSALSCVILLPLGLFPTHLWLALRGYSVQFM